MVKQWKSNGPEQEHLERMFDEGSIDEWETPASVQVRDPIFKPFSERVFATHFRETKLKMGYDPNSVRQPNSDNNIPELGLVVGQKNQARPSTSVPSKLDSNIQFKNAPYLTWTYTDHYKNLDFVCVAVSMISGCRDINFMLSEDGTKLQINYVWPSALYTPQELFRDKLKGDNALTMDHPKIHALTSRLLECELTAKSMPQASIVIDLPIKVLREIGTWSKCGVKSSESRIAMLEFQAFQNKVIIEDADTTISFD